MPDPLHNRKRESAVRLRRPDSSPQEDGRSGAQSDLEDWMPGQRDAIAAHIAVAFDQAERGELIDGDAAIAMLRQRRAERLKLQGRFS